MNEPQVMQVDEQLRNATIEVLRERGWDGLTLERVAEVAGRARSTLWRQGLDLDALIGALVGELAADFRATMYPILTSRGTGRERLARGLEELCGLLDRHLPLMLATDEAFHQRPGPDQPHDYLHPFIQFLREGSDDGSLSPVEDPLETADVVFNAVAWPYVHLRGRHDWPAELATTRVVDLVLNGLTGGAPPAPVKRRKESR
jgi:AcrR family transcriptional regulator